MTKSGYVQVDIKQLQGEIRERNIYFQTIKKCQEICARYSIPDSTLSAEQGMSELIGILDDKKLIELEAIWRKKMEGVHLWKMK